MKKLIATMAPLMSLLVGPVIALAQPQASAPAAVGRPPQFVMLAFDGSLSNSMWESTRQFSKEMTAQGSPVHFTYFISGVYWLTSANKELYHAPHHKVGHSAIGFGGESTQGLAQRIDETNMAYEEGNEIGSHANGHYDASDYESRGKSDYAPWSLADWSDEFRQFFNLIFNVFQNNGIQKNVKYPTGYAFDQKEITGFRAPLLGVTDGLWPALANNGFKYDTSKVNYPTYWPKKDSFGLWQFPLAEVRIAGTGKKTLSMDYNFYYTQSQGHEDLVNKEIYKKQMHDTYLNYFNNNYYGNRAPINIGHHFSLWNGGIYWEAMQEFAKEVCGQPEVRCVTYTSYMNWLESQGEDKLAEYRKGHFAKMPQPPGGLVDIAQPVDVNVSVVQKRNALVAVSSGSDLDMGGVMTKLSINGQMLDQTRINLSEIRESFPVGSQVSVAAHVFDAKGIELNRSTQVINNLGTSEEEISTEPWEANALRGDMPEAHMGEQEALSN